MSGKRVLAVSGSPSTSSKSSRLAGYVLERLASNDVEISHIPAQTLNPNALLSGDAHEPSIAALVEAVDRAHGVVLTTPIFKAAYSGLLKMVLDVLPQFALAGKVVLPLATGATPAHVLALDYALRPVLQSMGVRHTVQSHFVADSQIQLDPFALEPGAAAPLTCALRNFLYSLTDDSSARWLGHPRPPENRGGAVNESSLASTGPAAADASTPY